MLTISMEDEARLILDHFRQARYRDIPPQGWTKLGDGSFREAFLSPSKIVYKIGDPESNADECAAIEIAMKRPLAGWYVPWVKALPDFNYEVIAMEYIEGEFDCNPCPCENCPEYGNCPDSIWTVAFRHWEVDDFHEGNVIVMDNGIRAMIDWNSI